MPDTRRSALHTLTSEQRDFIQPPVHSSTGSQTTPVDANVSLRRGLPLRSITLRLTPATATALRRVASERALAYQEPYSQQSIAEQALRDWLARHGYRLTGSADLPAD